ncbi:Transposase and inactivated derivatives [Enterococcus gallinarum]|uniref:Mutator family transposase n=1 Tax=Enterococcus gallinarum TaxID=1353 RepID=A0A376H518_ENTGA|nr:Transposase and inactivated derivatives [Enterococcus gallinarum]STD83468.1 Transposase and inactivated derivatives [Enterococcus gallinarum]
MNDFTTEILKTLANKGDLNELFRVHLEKAVNTLLKTELTAFLDYEKYDRIGFNTGNSRNGSYDRTVKTEYGELHLQIPRDRNGEFKQQTVPAYRRTNDTLEETVIHLFRKGITMSEIADLIEKMYGHYYTPQTMSNITKSFTEEVTAFKGRELHDRYAAIYMDATYIPLKRKTVAKEAIHIAVGIRPDGSKEVLSYAIAPTESITIWEEILLDLQERGLKNVLLFITDGLKGMVGAISRFYPKLVFNIVVYTFPVISVTKCVSMIVRKSVMILKWCIKPHLKRWRWKHVVLLRKNGKPAIQKWLNRFFRTITCSLSMISPWPYARVFILRT